MLQLEVNRMQGEMSVERSKMEGLEMALEERRRALEMAEDALQRKREKKKGWKSMQGEGGRRREGGGDRDGRGRAAAEEEEVQRAEGNSRWGGHRAQLMCSACRHPTLFSPLPGGSFRSLNLSFPFRGD